MYDYNVDRIRLEHHYRKAQMEKMADSQRLLRGSQVYQQRLYQQALAKAGDWLIAAGTTLKDRQSQMNPNWQV